NQSRVDTVSLTCANVAVAQSSVNPSGTTVIALSSAARIDSTCVINAATAAATTSDNATLAPVASLQQTVGLSEKVIQTNSMGSFDIQITLPQSATEIGRAHV